MKELEYIWSSDYLHDETYSQEYYLQDINELASKIGIPEYFERPIEFYIEKGILVKPLQLLLLKTPLQIFSRYLLFAGYEFSKLDYKEIKQKASNVEIRRKAELLLFLRKCTDENKKPRMQLYANEKTKYIIKDREIIDVVKIKLMEYFEKNHKLKFEVDNRSNDPLIEFINNLSSNRGKPNSNKKIAQFALFILSLINHDIGISTKIDKISNNDCRLIHDYLALFKIIPNKHIIINELKSKNCKTYITPHNHIRSLILNYIKQN